MLSSRGGLSGLSRLYLYVIVSVGDCMLSATLAETCRHRMIELGESSSLQIKPCR